jgi:PhnB protein
MATTAKPIPEGHHSITPYLIVDGAVRAIKFYQTVFDATEVMRISAGGDKIGHAELRIGDSVVMLADEHHDMDAHGPKAIGGTPVGLVLYVPDVDAVAKRAVDAGATLRHPIEDKFYGDRMGTLADPFGHVWHVATHKEDVTPDEIRRRADDMFKQHAKG